jgi:hypothetical protein
MQQANAGNVNRSWALRTPSMEANAIRLGGGLFTGPWDYSDLMVGWQGASAFTQMNNPYVPDFSNPTNDLVGLGVSGIVGVSGPFGATAALKSFATTGAYPAPRPFSNSRLAMCSASSPIHTLNMPAWSLKASSG